jgi:hypothetical protein
MVCAAAAAEEMDPAIAERFKKLEERLDAVEAENRSLRAEQKRISSRLMEVPSLTIADDVKLKFTGYTDFGLFKAMGDGVAYVRDIGHALHPELASFPWVFLGDPWANTINSQGDSADLGLDRTNIARYDPIQSHGKTSFIVNMVNLGIQATLSTYLFAEASINFEPRQGTLGSSGDQFDLDLAYLEFRPSRNLDLHLFAGKFESTFGIEYRRRKAPDRFGVTPSLISRYSVGTPTGLKVRGSFLSGLITYNFAVTNGGMSTEKFAHFYNELDRNDWKTLSGRLSIGHKFDSRVPFEIEAGGSGIFGAQDLQPSETTYQWQGGADLRLEIADFSLRAEYLKAHADGGGVTGAPFLDAQGAYGELSYQIFGWLGVMGRVDWRKAKLFAPPNFYLTNDLRVTAAVRFDIKFNIIAKVEYVRLQELEGPEIDDDVFTSSLIFRF